MDRHNTAGYHGNRRQSSSSSTVKSAQSNVNNHGYGLSDSAGLSNNTSAKQRADKVSTNTNSHKYSDRRLSLPAHTNRTRGDNPYLRDLPSRDSPKSEKFKMPSPEKSSKGSISSTISHKKQLYKNKMSTFDQYRVQETPLLPLQCADDSSVFQNEGTGAQRRQRHRSEGDKNRLRRSVSSDMAVLRNKAKFSGYRDSKQSYSPLLSENSPDSGTKSPPEFSDKTKSLQAIRTRTDSQNSEKHSLQKLSKYQRYFYTDEIPDSRRTESSLTSKHLGDYDHKSPSIETSVDLEGIEADFSDYYSFPALEGYRLHGLKHSFPSSTFGGLKRVRTGSICSIVLGGLLTVIFGILFLCPLAAFMLLLFPLCYLIKMMFSCCCCYGNGCECGELLTRKELMWIDDDNNCTTYQGILFIEFGLDLNRIRDLVNARLICAEDKSKMKLYPKFTKKIAHTCSGPAWAQDHSFVINNHVFSMPKNIENFEDLQEYISEMSTKPLSRQSPLWEIQVLKNFGDHKDTVLLIRVHPIMSDGISLVHLIFASLSDMENVATIMPKMSQKRKWLNTIKAVFTGPIVFLNRCMCASRDFNMLHGKHVHVSGKRVISWSEPFDLEAANRIRQVTRSSLNDVLLSVTAGSLRSYLQVNGIVHPFNMQTLVPVYYHSGSSELPTENNQCLFLSVTLPANTEGAIPRLWHMKNMMNSVRNSALFSITQGVFHLTSSLFPRKLFQKMWNSVYSKCTCIVSNVPGPGGTLKFGSRQIKSMVCWMPPIKSVAVAITYVTYGNEIRMAVMSDRAVLPNPEMLTKDFNFQMENLSQLLANRRIPGEYLSKKTEFVELHCEIHAEQTVEQIQHKMTLIQQELHDLKCHLDSDSRHKHVSGETKILKKIDTLKEQFRELLVEMRQRKAAEAENAIVLSEDDLDDDLDEDGEPRRPFRRRTLSMSSRLSTVSQSSTVRPLAASPSVQFDMSSETDSMSQVSFRMDGITQVGRPQYYRQLSHQPNRFEIIEYASSPSVERRFRTF